jgi:hypothetical protein
LLGAESWDLFQDILNVAENVNKAAKLHDWVNSLNAPHMELYGTGCSCRTSPYSEYFISMAEILPKTFVLPISNTSVPLHWGTYH